MPTSPVSAPIPSPPGGPSLGDQAISGTQVLATGMMANSLLSNRSTVSLMAGTYAFSNITNKGQDVTIDVISGPVVIYFSGRLDLGQDTRINATGLPTAFLLFGTTAATSVSLGQDTLGSFALYAPTASLSLGQDADRRCPGRKSLSLGQNASIHYDQAL